MSTISMSLDTKSRQVVLSIDGIISPVYECGFHKYVYDGKEELTFWYSVERTNDQGLKECVRWSLPTVEDLAQTASIDVNDHGLTSAVVLDEEKSVEDLSKYISQACKFDDK